MLLPRIRHPSPVFRKPFFCLQPSAQTKRPPHPSVQQPFFCANCMPAACSRSAAHNHLAGFLTHTSGASPTSFRGLLGFPMTGFRLGCILPTIHAPGQRAFSRCAASFFLEIRQYSCKKMSCSARKSSLPVTLPVGRMHPCGQTRAYSAGRRLLSFPFPLSAYLKAPASRHKLAVFCLLSLYRPPGTL